MHSRRTYPGRQGQRGAITIMVALMLLVLLTIASLGLSKNSLRSAIAAGTVSQASQAQNTADTGLEWAVYWLANDPNNPSARANPTGGALALRNLRDSIQDGGSIGITSSPFTSSDFTISSNSLVSHSYILTLTLMGQIPPTNTSPTLGSSTTAFTPASLNLWAIGADGSTAYTGGSRFTRRREVWVTIPPN